VFAFNRLARAFAVEVSRTGAQRGDGARMLQSDPGFFGDNLDAVRQQVTRHGMP
jgi:hypothetical protein